MHPISTLPTAATRKELEATIALQAWRDKSFAAELPASGPSALRRIGFDIPSTLTVRTHREYPKTLRIVIPPKPKSGELSDESLAQVTGGVAPLLIVGGIALGALALGALGGGAIGAGLWFMADTKWQAKQEAK